MELPCHHRSQAPVGRGTAGCGGEKNVWRCALHGYVMLHAESLKSRDIKLHSPDAEGRRRIKIPGRRLPTCVLCRDRPQAPPEVAEFLDALPAADQDCYAEARRAICGACPRLDAGGRKFECPGHGQTARCPLDLWPKPTAPLRGLGGCRNCG